MLKLSPKISFLLLSFVMLTNNSFVSAVPLSCEYKFAPIGHFVGMDGRVYYCNAVDNGIFTGERVTIDSADGAHFPPNTNDDVEGVVFYEISSLNFFPRNLENVFENLKVIIIEADNLQEITQDDLKVFPKLQNLNLYNNKITAINENLFQFNPDLRSIYLDNNKISHIDPNVFDHLNDLSTLFLNDNAYKNDVFNAKSSRFDVSLLVQQVSSGKYSTIDGLSKKKEIQELPIVKTLVRVANRELSAVNDEIQGNLTTVIAEKSRLSKRFNDLRERFHETAMMNEESEKKFETCEGLRKQSENDFNESQHAVESLKTTIEMLRKSNSELREWKNKFLNKYQENELNNRIFAE